MTFPTYLDRLSAIAGKFDACILDLWGVVHDGSHLYPGAREALQGLHAQGKRVVFLSNAPRRSSRVIAVLDQLGVEPAWYETAISSGEIGFRLLQSGALALGKRYIYIGPEKDVDVLDGLDLLSVESVERADFILNVGFGTEGQSDADWTPLFRTARARNLPMLCLNPDREVVKISGERYPCAGVLAGSYQDLGGVVHWVGKPYPDVYDACFTHFGNVPRSRILAVGDGLHTDILGAKRAGITAVLVSGGILHQKSQAELAELFALEGATPDYMMTGFR